MNHPAFRRLTVPRAAQSLAALYEGTALRYPREFEALCLSHYWEEVELGDVQLADNPAGSDLAALAGSVRYDSILWEFLVTQGYLIFGRMSGGRYDPCAFNLGGDKKNRGAVVRVDHEDILSFERLGRPEIIAQSFTALLEGSPSGGAA